MVQVRRSELSVSLNEGHARSLSEFLTRESTKSIMPHALAVLLGLTYSDGLAILASLGQKGFANVILLVFHECDPELPAGTLPLAAGFPDLPWRCPNCELEASTYAELHFDFQAKLNEAVEVI